MTDGDQGLRRWRGKVALVTGASSGIGRATALALARAGMRLALTARREERIVSLADEIRRLGAEALPIPADFRDADQVTGLFGRLRAEWDRCDVLINNAGMGWEGDLREQRTEEWKEMLDVNVLALSIAMREALTDMERNGGGHIVNVSSIAGHRVFHHLKFTMYAAAKHAVGAISEGMRGELARRRSPVKLSVISPGMVETEWHAQAFRDPDRAAKAYDELKPLSPGDIADLICLILSTPPHVQINDMVVRSVRQLH